MKPIAKVLEWLRPLAEMMAWDYCIVWQFGDDPSRYIQWIGCCCIGSRGVCGNVKEEIDPRKQLVSQLCRDTFVEHSLNTKACEKLAKIPFYLPLYSGIHGEVAMSAQPSWSNDTTGTQVLIPVNGGLIELYISKQVPRDQQMIETIMAHFNIFSQHVVHLKTEGSPNVSNPWSENSSLVSVCSTHVSPTQSIDNSMNLLGYANSGQVKEYTKTSQKKGKERFISKNLVTERNRRKRIRDNLFTLRSLVPKISKMDRASIPGDAIEYIKELEATVKELQDELKTLEESEDEVEVCKPKKAHEQSPTKGQSLVTITTTSDIETKIQVDIHEIGAKEFMLKLISVQKRGGFQKILEIIDSLGLQVLHANVTTCNGRVLNNINVKVAKENQVTAKSLKELLLSKLNV